MTSIVMRNSRLLTRLALPLLALALVLTGCGSSGAGHTSAGGSGAGSTGAGAPIELRIGYQRGGIWSLLKAQQTLEKYFGTRAKITWTLFPSGPPLLEALNANSVDIGSAGDTPPIFAQAAGTPLRYVASQSSNGAGSAIIVPKDSAVKGVADLKGKKVAFTKGSASNLLIVRALRKFGLDYKDIEPVYLQPPEARAAFQGGSIDAWVIWNPFLEAAKQELGAREIINGADVSRTKGYILARDTFVDQHPEVVRELIDQAQKANEWGFKNRDEYAKVLEKETGIAADIWKAGFTTEYVKYEPINEEAIKYQQEVADIFYELKLIPNKLDIRSAVWISGQKD
jgi:sulfonate transport system substrate-binding protein